MLGMFFLCVCVEFVLVCAVAGNELLTYIVVLESSILILSYLGQCEDPLEMIMSG